MTSASIAAIRTTSAASTLGHFSVPSTGVAQLFGHPRNHRRVQGWAIAIGGTAVLWTGIIAGVVAAAHVFA